MKAAKFFQLASEAGFSQDQAELLFETFSLKPHTHTADQITDFDEAVTEIVETAETAVVDDEE